MVKASHSVRDSDTQNLDFILSEKNTCPASRDNCKKISKERDKRQNFVQKLRKVATDLEGFQFRWLKIKAI